MNELQGRSIEVIGTETGKKIEITEFRIHIPGVPERKKERKKTKQNKTGAWGRKNI